MNRRLALKQAIILAGGVAFMPSCTFDSERVFIALNNLKIESFHEKLLAEIVDTIIPATDTPGAKDLNVHHFVLVMIDDCLDKVEQDIFVNGLVQLNSFTIKNNGKSFLNSTQPEREEMLIKIMALKKTEINSQDIKKSLIRIKKLTIQGFLNSQYIMTEIFPYQLVPGEYKGCVKTANNEIINLKIKNAQ